MKDDKYLRISQVSERTGLSRPTIYNMVKAGSFPASTALGARAVGWLESELLKWMEGRKLVEKTGREAKPGNPVGRGGKKKKVDQSNQIQKSTNAQAGKSRRASNETVTNAKDGDWGWGDIQIDPQAQEAFRQRMFANKEARKQAATPVVRRGKTIKISG
jgi:prophage regulatory protein